MNNLISTSLIIQGKKYFDKPLDFFKAFPWAEVCGQVLKLETKQTYREPGNPSYEAFDRGETELALQLLPEVRSEDDGLYQTLAEKKVDFIRCRPVVRPISNYLKWELGCYKLNESKGERIYFTDKLTMFDRYALHDFMVFDRSCAMVHNYDETGEIQGGWEVKDTVSIDALIVLFSIIKATSVSYSKFLL